MAKARERIKARLVSTFQPDEARSLDAIIQYELAGDEPIEMFAVVKDGTFELRDGRSEHPKITITAREDDFLDLIEGRIGSMAAYATRKLKITGDLELGKKVSSLFAFRSASR